MYVTLLALPVLLVRQGRPGEAVAGLVLASMSAASLVVTPLGGRVVDRMGSRVPAVTGLSVLALSLVPLALWPAEAGPAAMVACMLVAGTGLGLASSALQVAAIGAVDAGSAGVASGVFSTSRYAGSIVGTALLAGPLAPADAGTAGFGLLFALLAVAAAASAACATRLPGASRRHAGPRTASAPAPAAARA
jgi:MFS family permease